MAKHSTKTIEIANNSTNNRTHKKVAICIGGDVACLYVATDPLKHTISTIGDATTKEMLVKRGGVDDLKTEKEIIERQQQLIDEEAQLQVTGDEKKKEDSKRHMRDLTDSVETLASDGVVDPD
eukprot:496010_1